jgi:hypothetical protein
VIEELRAQVEAVRDKIALAERAGLSDEAHLHRARLADLMDIAVRHGIDLTAPARPTVRTHKARTEGDPEADTPPVYVRVNTIFGPTDRIEAGITQIEGPDRAAVEATRGNRGLTTMVDREAAVIIAISYWDAPDRSSEAELTRARQNAVAAADGDLVAENLVLAFDERASISEPGSTMRLTSAQLAASHSAGGLTYLREEVLSRFRATAGFQHAQVLVDHGCGYALLITAWQDEDHAVKADAILDALRTDARHRAHLDLSSTQSYTLVRDAKDTRLAART